MVVHLGRLKIVTKRKEVACTYKFCSDVVEGNNGRILPGEKVFLLTKMGQIGTRTTIFGKYFHMTCFVAWAMWRYEQTPMSKDGRIGMQDISTEDKQARQRLVRNRAQLLRNLRTVSGERLTRTVDRIAELDKEITATGHPILQYRGRKSKTKMTYERFVQDVKEHYKHPLRVGRDMYAEAEKIGMLEHFKKDMDTWLDECNARVIERQGEDFEASQEDKEEE